MNATIYCKTTGTDKMGIFLKSGRESYYLFTQNYHKSSFNFFKDGVSLEEAMHNKKIGHDFAVTKIAEKLPSYISYVEKEYGIEVLEKTAKKNREMAKYHKHKALKLANPCTKHWYEEEMLVA